jgi:hypothetical protein
MLCCCFDISVEGDNVSSSASDLIPQSHDLDLDHQHAENDPEQDDDVDHGSQDSQECDSQAGGQGHDEEYDPEYQETDSLVKEGDDGEIRPRGIVLDTCILVMAAKIF